MEDYALTTEQRPTIYHEVNRRETNSQYVPISQNLTPRLLGMTGLTTNSPKPSPKADIKFQDQTTQQSTIIYPTIAQTQVYSKILQQPQSYVSPMRILPQQSVVPIQIIRSQSPPIIHQVHVHEQPVTVVQRDDLEKIYQEKYMRMESEMNRLISENIKLRSIQASEKLTITEDTTKVNHLATELDKFIRISREQEFEIEMWKKKYIDFEAQIQLQYGVEIDYMRVRNSLQETEIVLRAEINAQKGLVETWKEKYLLLQKEIYGFNAESTQVHKTKESKIRELQGKIALMTTEVERMNVLTSEKNKEIDRWKTRYNEAETNSLEKDRLIIQLNTEIQKLKTVIDTLNSELKLQKSKQINPAEFQQKINLQLQEIDKLNHIIRQLQYENENNKQDITFLNQQLNDNSKYQSLQDKIFKLEGEVKKQQRAINDRDQTIGELQRLLRETQTHGKNSHTIETHTTYQNNTTTNHKKMHPSNEQLLFSSVEQEATKPSIKVTQTHSVHKY